MYITKKYVFLLDETRRKKDHIAFVEKFQICTINILFLHINTNLELTLNDRVV